MAKRVDLTPGTPAAEASGRVLALLAGEAGANVAGSLEASDPEALHDLRVAVRRARSVLRELRHVHPKERRKALRDELRWVQQLTGPVRDLDVQLAEWDELIGEGRCEPLREQLSERRRVELAELREGVQSDRFAAALRDWGALAAEPEGGKDGEEPIEALAAARIRKLHHKMVNEGSAIGEDTPDEALHELRKRGKELRYMLELFGGLFDRDVVKPLVKTLKGLQDVLGRHHDRSVQVERLRALDAPGLLAAVDSLLADQREARASFAERFAAFASDEQRELVRETFPPR